MRCRFACRLLIASATAVALASCSSKNPAQPSGSGDASIAAPIPLTPANNAQIHNSEQPLTLVAQNGISTNAGATYKFEIATDPNFTSIVQTVSIGEAAAGQTAAKLAALSPSKDYYWRVSETSGGTTSASQSFKFTIGAPQTLNAPVPLSPLTGSQTVPRPTFTTLNATKIPGTAGNVIVSYTFEVADNPAFNPDRLLVTVSEGAGTTSYVAGADFPVAQTLYWRVTANDVTNGVSSTPSTPQSFTVPSGTRQGVLALQEGYVLWPNAQPPGSTGHATMGDNWEVKNLVDHNGVPFVSPPLEALQLFDLLDRGYTPQGAIDWMHANGYATAAAYYSGPDVIGIGVEYIAHISGHWDLVLGSG